MAHDSIVLDDSSLTDSEYVLKYASLVEFLGVAFGKTTEVVLHDAANLDESVVAIANGHVTGREIGSPATDLILRAMRTEQYKGRAYVTGYMAVSSTTAKRLRSATYFIRRDGRLVGALCINSDQTLLRSLEALVTQIGDVHFEENNAEDKGTIGEKPEYIGQSISDMTSSAIDGALNMRPFPVTHYTPEDRLKVVEYLEEDGFFQLKGAVTELAGRLGVSEPSIYRYLKQIRASNVH